GFETVHLDEPLILHRPGRRFGPAYGSFARRPFRHRSFGRPADQEFHRHLPRPSTCRARSYSTLALSRSHFALAASRSFCSSEGASAPNRSYSEEPNRRAFLCAGDL